MLTSTNPYRFFSDKLVEVMKSNDLLVFLVTLAIDENSRAAQEIHTEADAYYIAIVPLYDRASAAAVFHMGYEALDDRRNPSHQIPNFNLIDMMCVTLTVAGCEVYFPTYRTRDSVPTEEPHTQRLYIELFEMSDLENTYDMAEFDIDQLELLFPQGLPPQLIHLKLLKDKIALAISADQTKTLGLPIEKPPKRAAAKKNNWLQDFLSGRRR